MDYGDRQQRAEYLIKRFRSEPSKIYRDWKDVFYTYAQIADDIENMTEFGRTIVAVAGLVSYAMNATPEFFKDACTGCGKVVLGPHACPGRSADTI
jgi:hypothetical protein